MFYLRSGSAKYWNSVTKTELKHLKDWGLTSGLFDAKMIEARWRVSSRVPSRPECPAEIDQSRLAAGRNIPKASHG
jgi:hypothetical protein